VDRATKEQHVEALRKELEGIKSAFLCGYRGLTVNQVSDLRTKVRKTSSSYRVLKNRLASRALESTPLAPLREHLRGPLALAFHPSEPVALAKVLADFAKENPLLELKAGWLDGKPLTPADLSTLAALPSREVLLGQLLGQMTSPLASFQRVLLAPMRDLASVLDQIAKKQQPKEAKE
jgi:large subunit ribosomal protein L10